MDVEMSVRLKVFVDICCFIRNLYMCRVINVGKFYSIEVENGYVYGSNVFV